ncbi:MAG: hypothetical protein AAFP23_01990, partial [Pseudomonadota bacterium]
MDKRDEGPATETEVETDMALPAQTAEAPARTILTKAQIAIRTAVSADIPGITALTARAYPGETPYTPGQIRGQINSFPEGQFVVTFDDQVVGYAATFIISERLAMADHTWSAITGAG